MPETVDAGGLQRRPRVRAQIEQNERQVTLAIVVRFARLRGRPPLGGAASTTSVPPCLCGFRFTAAPAVERE